MDDTTIVVDGKTYHRAELPDPENWVRVSDAAVRIRGHEGTWCCIEESEFQFDFIPTAEHREVQVFGFRDASLDGRTIPTEPLERGDLEEVKRLLKQHGLPEYTVINLLYCYEIYLIDRCFTDEELIAYETRPYTLYPDEHIYTHIGEHMEVCTLCCKRVSELLSPEQLVNAIAGRMRNELNMLNNVC